jgi:DNA-binding beta-propeller fold protein YncE
MADHLSSQQMRILTPILAAALLAFLIPLIRIQAAAAQHLLYVVSPGIRNYVEYGGVGILVFDIDKGYKFVRRIPTWDVPEGKKPENIKGIAASAKTGRVYVTSLSRMIAIDAVTGKKIWDKTYQGGCDRMVISPDGKNLYVPQLEGPAWHVVNTASGDLITTIETKSGSHNTIYSADGTYVYLAGLNSKLLFVADTKTNTIARTVGPLRQRDSSVYREWKQHAGFR